MLCAPTEKGLVSSSRSKLPFPCFASPPILLSPHFNFRLHSLPQLPPPMLSPLLISSANTTLPLLPLASPHFPLPTHPHYPTSSPLIFSYYPLSLPIISLLPPLPLNFPHFPWRSLPSFPPNPPTLISSHILYFPTPNFPYAPSSHFPSWEKNYDGRTNKWLKL